MYPDGRYHTVNANRFYSVIYQGKETYVVDYDDLTANARNCFTILEKETPLQFNLSVAEYA
jgi:hypothetical protein